MGNNLDYRICDGEEADLMKALKQAGGETLATWNLQVLSVGIRIAQLIARHKPIDQITIRDLMNLNDFERDPA